MATRKCHAADGHPSRVATGLGSETGRRDVMRFFLAAGARHGDGCGAEFESHDAARLLDLLV